MPGIDHLASVMLTRLFWTSVQAALLAGIVMLLIRLLPRLPASARCALWWLVTLQVVLGLAWQSPIRLPLLASPPAMQATLAHSIPAMVERAAAMMPPEAPKQLSGGAASVLPTAQVSRPGAGLFAHWPAWLAALWLLGLAAQVPGIVLHRSRLRGLRRAATPADESLRALCVRKARAMGLSRCPNMLISPTTTSPMVTGLLRPTILWPERSVLTAEESAIALAHEFAHVQRADPWFAILPALARWLFWFHPLVHHAASGYALYREAACDAVALQHGSTPHAYGSLLLRLGVQQPACAGLGGASSTFRNLKQRLAMLEHHSSRAARLAGWALVLLTLAAALPYRLVGAATHASAATANAPRAGGSRPAIPTPPTPSIPPRLSAPSSTPSVPAAPGVPPAPPAPPPPPTGFHASNVDTDIDSSARRGIILFGADSVLIKGNQADHATAERLYKANHGQMLWFRRGDHAWMTRNPETIQQVEAIYAKVTAVRREAADLDAEKWRTKGPLEGLRDRQQDVDARIRGLRADPSAPAASARLASLHEQKARIDAHTTELRHRLAALQPQLDAMARRERQTNDRADRRIEQLMAETVTHDKAQATTL